MKIPLLFSLALIGVTRFTAYKTPVPLTSLPPAVVLSDTIIHLSATDECINIMGKRIPAIPAFPALAKKPGILRGYVKDASGKPLEGAYIGVRSSVVGGLYSAATGETDTEGYYEISLPFGSVHFYAACFTAEYGEGYLPLSLHAADGKAGSFASQQGQVENFVLLPYGIANKQDAVERPWYAPNYFGGAVRLSYELGNENDMWAPKGCLSENDEVEITLHLDSEALYSGTSNTFIIRKKTGNRSFIITNIPVGRYSISARLVNGKALTLKSTGLPSSPVFGLQPKNATGKASLLLTPGLFKKPLPNQGNWAPVEIKLEK